MENISKENIVKMIDGLPAFSATVAKVIKLSSDPKAAPKDIIHAISIDPVLTAKVLRLINSAYFGVPFKVVSLNRAVVMLGLNTIKNVAIGSSVLTKVKMSRNFKWFTNDEFWEHSLGCGVGARILAAHIGVPAQNREEYFIAGLLHDIGKVVLIQNLPEEFSRLADPGYSPEDARTSLETKEFGINHAELGSLMAQKWKLPGLLAEAIVQHHAPVFEDNELDMIKAAVHLSDIACNNMGVGIKKYVDMDIIKEEIWKKLSVDPDKLENIFDSLNEKVAEAKVFLIQ
ncbi:MAG: histidine kinase [bacterium]|nr:MAG: histidine kinase [bacterium]